MNSGEVSIRVVKEGRLSLRIKREDAAILIGAKGEIDVSSASCLIRELQVALGGDADRVIFDMTALDFIDSAGLAALLGAQRGSVGSSTSLVFIRPAGSVAHRLELTGIGQELDFLY